MGPPLLIGAGLGAATSLAMGKNPFMGALLGGATGGAFGGAGGFGSGFGLGGGGFLSGLQGVAPEAVSLGSGGYAALGQNALGPIGGAATGGINFGVNGINSTLGGTNLALGGQGINNLSSYANPLTNVAKNSIGIGTQGISGTGITLGNIGGADIRRLAVNTPLSFGERLSDLGSSAFSYGKENPASLLSGANTISNMSANAEAQNTQQLNNAVATGAQPITQKDFDPSSVIAAAPSYGLSRDEMAAGKVGQIASQTRLNDEDERKIRQFYTSLIG